jgi:hypothetical protein
MKNILIGWLAGRGVTLDPNASDQAVVAAVQTAATADTGKITALGNDKAGLETRITALENERDTAKREKETAATALANEQTARKAERRGRAEAMTDLAIHRGILTIAEREDQVTALENSADFNQDAKALLGKPATHKTTTNNLAQSGKQGAALDNEAAVRTAEYDAAFKVELPLNNQDPVKAHRAIMTKPQYAGLAAKFTPKQ